MQLHAESSQNAKGKGKARTLEAEHTDDQLFEPLTHEYFDANTRLAKVSNAALQYQQNTSHVILELLRSGQEAKAAELLSRCPQGVPLDAAFEPIAASFLSQGNAQAFLRWWALTPDSSGLHGWKSEAEDRSKADVHTLERQLLALPNTGDRLDILQHFGLLAASKGKAAYVVWTLQELAMFLPKGDLQPYLQRFRKAVTKRADALAAGSWAQSKPYKAQARNFLDHLQSRLMARRARTGFPVEAVKWVLDSKMPKPHFNQARILVNSLVSIYHSVQIWLHALPPQDPTAIELRNLYPHLRSIVKMHAPRLLIDVDSDSSTLAIIPEAPSLGLSTDIKATPAQDETLGMNVVKSMGLLQSRDSIRQATQWGGLKRISAGTLAGYIQVHLRCYDVPQSPSSVDITELQPWNELDIPLLDPTVNNAAKTLWVSAFMLFHLKTSGPERAIETFATYCMPFGAPTLLTSHMRQQNASADGGRDLVWPSRFAVSILWKALVEQCHTGHSSRSALNGLDALYQSFFKTFYGSQACPVELRPDVVTYQPFIEAFAAQNMPYRCMEILTDMCGQGVKPDSRSWAPIFGALARQPDPKLVFTILNKMEDSTYKVPAELGAQESQLEMILEDAPAPTIATYTTLIKGFAMSGLPSLSRQIQVRLEARLTTEEMEWHWTRNSRLRSAVERVEQVEMHERGAMKTSFNRA